MDAADNYIVTHVLPGDLVITSDVPLAYEVVMKMLVLLILREKNILKKISEIK